MADQPIPTRFGNVEVRPAQRQLLIDGQPATLGARAFDLLLALIEHRDRLVSKNELLDLVWPGLVVEENNLQVQVSTLRKLLGPKAIATVPGRGYRFTLAGDVAGTPSSPPPRPPQPQRSPSMLGRDADLQVLLKLIDQHALVTLLGPGGIGKTTLSRCAAQASAERWADGCAWVELASLTDGQLIPGSIAQALNLQLAPGGNALGALVAALKPMQLLLVIDNAEHLVDTLAPLIEAVLAGAPGLHVLVTSQSALRARSEQTLRLEALAVPRLGTAANEAIQHGAIALFTERAQAADRRFVLNENNVAHVIEICHRLDGLPLALEFAAARVPLLGVRGVAERLDDRFKLLASGNRSAPSRQQTLQAALDWSLALLLMPERLVFQQLGVFAGGFTLSLAREVLVGDALDEWTLIDALAALADHSLLSVSSGEVPRYALGETARAYALGLGIPPALQVRHATALQAFFEAASPDWLQMTDVDWLARYEPELDNLRAALDSARALKERKTVIALVGAAAPLWHYLSLYDEARAWHELSEPMLGEDIPKPLAARWWRAAQWAWSEVSPSRARAAAEKAHELYRQIGDVHGLYAELTGLAGMWTSADPHAMNALNEALKLERPDWPARERAWGQRARADVARAHGNLLESWLARQEELSLRNEAGDERGTLRAMLHLSALALDLDQVDEAIALAQKAVSLLRHRRSPSTLQNALTALLAALRVKGDSTGVANVEKELSTFT